MASTQVVPFIFDAVEKSRDQAYLLVSQRPNLRGLVISCHPIPLMNTTNSPAPETHQVRQLFLIDNSVWLLLGRPCCFTPKACDNNKTRKLIGGTKHFDNIWCIYCAFLDVPENWDDFVISICYTCYSDFFSHISYPSPSLVQNGRIRVLAPAWIDWGGDLCHSLGEGAWPVGQVAADLREGKGRQRGDGQGLDFRLKEPKKRMVLLIGIYCFIAFYHNWGKGNIWIN